MKCRIFGHKWNTGKGYRLCLRCNRLERVFFFPVKSSWVKVDDE